MEDKDLGVVLATRGVESAFKKNDSFKDFALNCLFSRYLNNDWGDMCEEDKALNDLAVVNEDRVCASYNIPKHYGVDEDKIWIITEWDRSSTTLLFPNEY